MCWVMPPASPSTTFVSRIRSSSRVLPWSTWPMTVTTGGRRGAAVRVVAGVDPEELAELGLLLLAGIDETDLGADLGREQLHHLVAERLGGGHHLAVLHQEADHVGGGAVELGTEVLGGRGPLHHHDALGHRRVARRVGRHVHRLQFLADPAPAALAAGRAPLGAAGASPAAGAARRTGRGGDGGRRAVGRLRRAARRGGGLPGGRTEGGFPAGGNLRRTAAGPGSPPRGPRRPGRRAGGDGGAEGEAGSACPTGTREGFRTGGGRGGAVPVGGLWAAGFGGGWSAAGWGSGIGGRLAGATLPLEEIVTFGLAGAGSGGFVLAAAGSACFGLAAVGSAACVLAAAGAACCPVRAAAGAAGAAGRGLESGAASAAGLAGAASSGADGTASALAAAGFLVSAGAATGFLASGTGASTAGGGGGGGGGSGGGGGFRSPSRSALRRTRSAWASTMLEECDLTPMLSAMQRSSVSWLVQPELLGEFVDADLAWQSMPPSGPAGAAVRPGGAPPSPATPVEA